MGNITKEIDDMLIRTGLAAKWEAEGEARGEERKALDIAKNMIQLGLPLETIISATLLDPEKIEGLYDQGE